MERTNEQLLQHRQNSRTLDLAREQMDRRQWSDALVSIDKVLNSGERSFFTSAEVWMLKAIAERRLGRVGDATSSMQQSRQLLDSDDNEARYLRHVAHHCAETGDHEALKDVLDNHLASLPGFDQGWSYMMRGRAVYASGRNVMTRGLRNERLALAADLFQAAEDFWAHHSEQPVSTRNRVNNLVGLFGAYAAQSGGLRAVETLDTLRMITELDETLGADLKKKLRWHRWLGLTWR